MDNEKKHVWHPYSSIDDFEKNGFPVIKSAKGSYFYDTNDKAYLDGIASWWCVSFGHSHPELIKAIQKQSSQLQHVILGGLSHESIIALSRKLVRLMPSSLQHCFFASDGSSAIEASLRMALQYWENKGVKNKKKFICLQDGYHGDTLGAVGVGYIDAFHKEIKSILPDNPRAISPHCAKCPFKKHPSSCHVECFSSMENLVKTHHAETAAVIIEPLCQGAAGIRLYPEAYLQKLKSLCDEYGLLLIADEIAVGLGRMGTMSACEKADIQPDILTLGKALTGGYLPMSVSMVTDEIYDSFRGGKTFYYGHTFTGNPISAALALRALELFEEENVLHNVNSLSPLMNSQMSSLCSQYFPSSFTQTKGFISMIELSEEDGGAKKAKAITQEAMKHGLFIRPMGSTLYLWPPLNISKKELEECFNILKIKFNKLI